MTHEIFDSVWDALEDDPIQRENLRLRSQLMSEIIAHIKNKKLTQEQAAQLLHTTQARVSKLMNGKINDFRVDTLINFVNRLGLFVSLDVGHFQSSSMA